jgi:hypothetical protein
MVTDTQLALFANFMGTMIFVFIVSYHYLIAYKDEK